MIRRLIQLFVLVGMAAACVAQSKAPAKSPTGWRTYRSPDYGFTIEYPSGGFTPGYRLDPQRSMIPVCEATSLACFEYKGDAFKATVIESLGVSVNVLRDSKTKADCDYIDNQPVKTIVIHGVPFRFVEAGGAALGQSEGGKVYHAFHQNVCFEITVGSAQWDVGAVEYKELGIHRVNQRALRTVSGEMDRMLHSFVFSGPVRDGPAWNTYVSTNCAAWYEVPSDTEIEEVLPYSPGPPSSESVNCTQSFNEGDRLYVISEKTNFADDSAIDDWLAMSAYPGLAHARKAADRTLEYMGSDLAYRVIRGELILFAVSNANGASQPAQSDRTFAHLVESFRCP
jgi:hypothetical protein